MPVQGVDQERILVCVSASPTSSDVIHRAARLSHAVGAELIALYVEDSDAQDDEQEKAVHEHLALAERKGAVITTIYGDDPATAIAQYARVSGITKIVLGKSPGRRSLLALKGTLMSRLNELAPDVEIVIVPNHLQEDTRRFSLKKTLLKEKLTATDLIRTILILALCTGMGFLFSAVGLAITNVVLIYILGVMAVALFTKGYIYSLLSSLLSVLIFNFFFTEPYYSLQSSPDYIATFAVMFAAAILSSERFWMLYSNSSAGCWNTAFFTMDSQTVPFQKRPSSERLRATAGLIRLIWPQKGKQRSGSAGTGNMPAALRVNMLRRSAFIWRSAVKRKSGQLSVSVLTMRLRLTNTGKI